MAVYIDHVHMVADSMQELHAFAATIGLGRHYYEGYNKGHPHYDLVKKGALAMAITHGAKVVGSKELLQKSKDLHTRTEYGY